MLEGVAKASDYNNACWVQAMDEWTRERLHQFQHRALVTRLRAQDSWDRLQRSQRVLCAGHELVDWLTARFPNKQPSGDNGPEMSRF